MIPQPPNGPRHSISRHTSEYPVPTAYRIVDWTRFDSAPSPADISALLANVARDGAARLAVLVRTPKVLQAANVFAEQAEMQGARVRVFIGSTEAMAWLYRDMPADDLPQDWSSAPDPWPGVADRYRT